MTESREARLKRLHMRSMRRGIKEMDLILSAFAGARLSEMDDAELDLYDRLLGENDHDLYAWVTGHQTPPEALRDMVLSISQTFNK